MSINKDDIVQRKEQIMKDFETLTKEVEATENKIKQMRNNLNVSINAAQQCDLFLKQIEEKGESNAARKTTSIRYCYIIGDKMNKLTQEELNGLSLKGEENIRRI